VHFVRLFYLYSHMLVAYKGQLNILALPLDEAADCSQPYIYSFRAVLDTSDAYDYEYIPTPQPNAGRLNIIHLTEGVDITFGVEGVYLYEVTQIATGLVVRRGSLHVYGAAEEPTIYTNDNLTPLIYGN
jgi:hypothetical protein